MLSVENREPLDSSQTSQFGADSSVSNSSPTEILRPSTLFNQRQQQFSRPNSVSGNTTLPNKRPSSFDDFTLSDAYVPAGANPSPPLSVVSIDSVSTPPVAPINDDGDARKPDRPKSRPNSDGALQQKHWDQVMSSINNPIFPTPGDPTRSQSITVVPRNRRTIGDNAQEESSQQKPLMRRNTYGPEFGTLDSEDKVVLEGEISSRLKAARRASKRKKEDIDEPIYGTRIGEDHVNYVLMYNMLTGIRVAVSRVSAKPPRELSPEDFRAAHKLAFDIMGNELTPGVKYDFKFKDYAPWVFRHLRGDFHIDPADYLVSLTSKYILSELSTPGKSGSFFYYSRDYRFIIKTIHSSEHKFMRRILKDYYQHVQQNPHTLLSRFYGLHRVKLPRGRKIHFVVMGNVFPPNKDVHETYDLKGSTFGREIADEDVKKKGSVMKDLNWVKHAKKLELGPVKRRAFIDQIERDVELLENLNIMDYSLLVGIHDLTRGNKDNIRDTTLSVFQPHPKTLVRQPSGSKRESKSTALRIAVARADPVQLGPSTSRLPEDSFSERRQVMFYSDEGGFLATDEFDQPSDALYFLGVIDILTPYNYVKRVETFWKGITQDKNKISSVRPLTYGKRFLDFMVNALKHHEDIPELQPHLSQSPSIK